MKSIKDYSDKQISEFRVSFIVLGVVLILMGLPALPLGLLSIILGVILLFISHHYKVIIDDRHKTTQTNIETVDNATTCTDPTESNDVSDDVSREVSSEVNNDTKNYDLLEDILDGQLLAYEYEDNICLNRGIFENIHESGGETLRFVKEPENEYDNKAVAIYLDDLKIGYVYKGKIQDMLNDWISRNDVYHGYVNKIDISARKASFKIGFYRPVEKYKTKEFPLVKTGKKIDEDTKREDNIYNIDVGDRVYIEYDGLESYVVFNEWYNEIGELPKSAINFIDDHDTDDIIGIVSSHDIDDYGKDKLKIKICLK